MLHCSHARFAAHCTVNNFGSQKVWQKGLLQGIGKKALVNKVWVVAVRFQLEISTAPPFRQHIANLNGFQELPYTMC